MECVGQVRLHKLVSMLSCSRVLKYHNKSHHSEINTRDISRSAVKKCISLKFSGGHESNVTESVFTSLQCLSIKYLKLQYGDFYLTTF